MRPPIIIGSIFGIFNLATNIFIATNIKDNYLGLILSSGLLFFNCIFTLLFIKKNNQYQLQFVDGLKNSVQCGIVQSFFYFLSIVLVQNYFKNDFFPELHSIKQYLLIFNVNIILFSFFSVIFGLIASGFLSNSK